MKPGAGHSENNRIHFGIRKYGVMFLGIIVPLSVVGPVQGSDPFEKPTAQSSEAGTTVGLALDQVNWKRPQAVFSWITIARGYETPWDSFGRQGWMTQDAYIEPIDPGVTEFPPQTPEIFIVFEGQPLDAPGQFAAAWYPLADGKPLGEKPLGKDVIELEMNQKYGYFILRPQGQKWEKGKYLVKVYYGSPGQQLHETNVVGTLQFTIKE